MNVVKARPSRSDQVAGRSLNCRVNALGVTVDPGNRVAKEFPVGEGENQKLGQKAASMFLRKAYGMNLEMQIDSVEFISFRVGDIYYEWHREARPGGSDFHAKFYNTDAISGLIGKSVDDGKLKPGDSLWFMGIKRKKRTSGLCTVDHVGYRNFSIKVDGDDFSNCLFLIETLEHKRGNGAWTLYRDEAAYLVDEAAYIEKQTYGMLKEKMRKTFAVVGGRTFTLEQYQAIDKIISGDE